MPSAKPGLERPALTVTLLAARRPGERRGACQQLVEEEAESVDDATLGRGEPCKLFGRSVAGILPGGLCGRERHLETQPPEDQPVRSAKPHLIALVRDDDDVLRGDPEVQHAEIQDLLQSLADPYRQDERPSGLEWRRPLQQLVDRGAFEKLGNQEESAVIREATFVDRRERTRDLQPRRTARAGPAEALDTAPVVSADLLEDSYRNRPPGLDFLGPVQDLDLIGLESPRQAVAVIQHGADAHGQRQMRPCLSRLHRPPGLGSAVSGDGCAERVIHRSRPFGVQADA